MVTLNWKNWKKLRWSSKTIIVLVCVISLFNFINTEEVLTKEEKEFCTQAAFHKLTQNRYVSSRKMTWVKAQACCALRNNSLYKQEDARNETLKSRNGNSIKQKIIDISEKYFWIDRRNSGSLSYCSALQNEKDSSVYDSDLLRPCLEERYFVCHNFAQFDSEELNQPKTLPEGGKSLTFDILGSNKEFNYYIVKEDGASKSPAALLTWLEAMKLIQDEVFDGLFLDMENNDDLHFLENTFSSNDEMRHGLTWIPLVFSKELTKWPRSKLEELEIPVISVVKNSGTVQKTGTTCGAVGIIHGRTRILPIDCSEKHILVFKREIQQQPRHRVIFPPFFKIPRANTRRRRQAPTNIPGESSIPSNQNAQPTNSTTDGTLNQPQIQINQQQSINKNESLSESVQGKGPLPQGLHASMMGLLFKRLQAGHLNQTQVSPVQTPLPKNQETVEQPAQITSGGLAPPMQQSPSGHISSQIENSPAPQQNWEQPRMLTTTEPSNLKPNEPINGSNNQKSGTINQSETKSVPSSRALDDNEMTAASKLVPSIEADQQNEESPEPPEIYENTEPPINQPKPEPVQQRSLLSNVFGQSPPDVGNLIPPLNATVLANNPIVGLLPNIQQLVQVNVAKVTESNSVTESLPSLSDSSTQRGSEAPTQNVTEKIETTTVPSITGMNLSPTTNSDSTTPSPEPVPQEPVQQKPILANLLPQTAPQVSNLISRIVPQSVPQTGNLIPRISAPLLGSNQIGGILPNNAQALVQVNGLNQGISNSNPVTENLIMPSSDSTTQSSGSEAPSQNVTEKIETSTFPTITDINNLSPGTTPNNLNPDSTTPTAATDKQEPVQQKPILANLLPQNAPQVTNLISSGIIPQSVPQTGNLIPGINTPLLGNNPIGGILPNNAQARVQVNGLNQGSSNNNPVTENLIMSPSDSTTQSGNEILLTTTEAPTQNTPATIDTTANPSISEQNLNSTTTNSDSTTPSPEPVPQEPVQQKPILANLLPQTAPQVSNLISPGIIPQSAPQLGNLIPSIKAGPLLGTNPIGGILPNNVQSKVQITGLNQDTSNNAATESSYSSDVKTSTFAQTSGTPTKNMSEQIQSTTTTTSSSFSDLKTPSITQTNTIKPDLSTPPGNELSQQSTSENPSENMSEEVPMTKDEYKNKETLRLLSLPKLGLQPSLNLPFQRALNNKGDGGEDEQASKEVRRQGALRRRLSPGSALSPGNSATEDSSGEKQQPDKEENKSCPENNQCKECSELLEHTKKLHVAVEKLLAKFEDDETIKKSKSEASGEKPETAKEINEILNDFISDTEPAGTKNQQLNEENFSLTTENIQPTENQSQIPEATTITNVALNDQLQPDENADLNPKSTIPAAADANFPQEPEPEPTNEVIRNPWLSDPKPDNNNNNDNDDSASTQKNVDAAVEDYFDQAKSPEIPLQGQSLQNQNVTLLDFEKTYQGALHAEPESSKVEEKPVPIIVTVTTTEKIQTTVNNVESTVPPMIMKEAPVQQQSVLNEETTTKESTPIEPTVLREGSNHNNSPGAQLEFQRPLAVSYARSYRGMSKAKASYVMPAQGQGSNTILEAIIYDTPDDEPARRMHSRPAREIQQGTLRQSAKAEDYYIEGLQEHPPHASVPIIYQEGIQERPPPITKDHHHHNSHRLPVLKERF